MDIHSSKFLLILQGKLGHFSIQLNVVLHVELSYVPWNGGGAVLAPLFSQCYATGSQLLHVTN